MSNENYLDNRNINNYELINDENTSSNKSINKNHLTIPLTPTNNNTDNISNKQYNKISTFNKFKITLMVVITVIILSPPIVGYILQNKIGLSSNYALSIFGIYSLLYIIIQIVCAIKNNNFIKNDRKKRNYDWNELGVGIMVVGYNEEKHLLKMCLESIKNSKYDNVKKIIFIIDGNTPDENYMADIFIDVFGNCDKSAVINLDKTLYDMNGTREIEEYYKIFSKLDIICITQPHGGKREGLYTGFKILLNDPNVKTIVTTDSDTILDDMAITELVYTSRHKDVGAVAGQISIWNTSESLMSNLVSYRYWLSFNLERACQSYWGTVLCVAGPMACYKSEVIRECLDLWYHQSFLGAKCTFGDDRHLTNCVLLSNRKVIYTKYAIGWTDTPSNYSTYLRQQTRWAKSYFRECLYNVKSIHLHSYWMCLELFYNILYFVLLMYWLLHILYIGSIYEQGFALIISLLLTSVKCIYGAIIQKNVNFFFFWLYPFIFSFIITPAKISALFTIYDTRWGTRGLTSSFIYTYWSTVLWISSLIGGFAYTIYKNHNFDYYKHYYKFAFIALICYFIFVMLILIIERYLRKNKKITNKIEEIIINKLNNENHNINNDNYIASV